MRQVSIRTIGLIRSTSLSDLACRWFTSLWMIQSLVDGWKHRLVPLGLLSLIEMCLLPQKPRQQFWHLDRKLKSLCVCVSVCLHICMCVQFVSVLCLFSLLDTCWSVSPSVYLSSYLSCHSCETPHLIPDGAADVLSLFSIGGTWGCHVPCAWNWAARMCTVEHLTLWWGCYAMHTVAGWLHVSSPSHPAASLNKNSSHMVHIIGLQTSDTLTTLAHYFYTHHTSST